VKIHNEFDVPLPPVEAWTTLRDIEEIVHCLPGAEITEKVDELVYRGHIAVKLGPVALRFRGTVQYTDINDTDRRASIQAQARDDKGRGGMHVLMDFNLEPVEDGSRVFVDTDLKLNGNIAQYGRAAGIVEQLADQIVAEFAKSLRMKLDETSTVDESAERQPVKPISAIGLVFKLLSGMFTRWNRALFRRS
jgi:carbon monoxide dehydrogenase subunit G